MSALQECVSACGPRGIRRYFENVFKLNTCPVTWMPFITHASKQKKNTPPPHQMNQKSKEENKSNKWALKPQPSLCVLVPKPRAPSAPQRPRSTALESSMLPQPGSGLTKVCAFWRKQGGQAGAGTYRCAGRRSWTSTAFPSPFTFPLCFECARCWCAQEKSN